MIVLISTYDLGRQPFGVASPLAWLRRAGVDAHAIDLSRDRLQPEAVSAASLVAVYLPMHTATRLALPVIDRVRTINPNATICAYGLYAPLNEAVLREHGVSVILGPEAEADLVGLATGNVRRGGTSDPPLVDERMHMSKFLALIVVVAMTGAMGAQSRAPSG